MSGYNPYQPPADDPVAHPASEGPGTGDALPWEIGGVLSAGWRALKSHWPVLVFAPIVVQVINQASSYAVTSAGAVLGGDAMLALTFANAALGVVLGAFFGVGTTRIFLAAARGESPDFGLLFSGADRFLPMLGTQILLGFAVVLGFICLVVPGVILALGFFYAPYLCVDQKLDPTDALRESWRITKGHKGNLFGLLIVSGFVVLAGLLALIVGVFVAAAVVSAGVAVTYLRLTGQSSIYEQT